MQCIEQIWALAVSSDEKHIVTGAADSVITVWRDYTEERSAEKQIDVERAVLKCVSCSFDSHCLTGTIQGTRVLELCCHERLS